MVTTRLTKRSEPEPATRASRGKPAAGRAQAAPSSSAKASRTLRSDENAPVGRRVLGDIQNVVAEGKTAIEARSSRRKPLSDRNAPVPTPASRSSDKPKRARESRHESDDFEKTFMKSTLSKSTRKLAEPKSVPAPKAAASGSRRERPRQDRGSQATFSHVEIPTSSSSKANQKQSLSSQIEAAERRALKAAPSHKELTRLSPGLDEDDLEYFDVSTLQQPAQSAQVAPKTAKRNKALRTEDKDSDEDTSPSQGSHGSSDKENVPPPADLSRSRASNRTTTTRARGIVLGAIEDGQPTHSTPISSKAKAAKGRASKSTYLDDVFLDESIHSSEPDSPGVARRAEPLPASAQQLLDYQERGVSKVKAWKAAGHDEARKARHDSPGSGRDDGSVASWPSRDDPSVGAVDRDGDTDNDDMDEFGFFTAEHKVRARRLQARDESVEPSEPSEDDDSDPFLDLPTDAPVNTTSDDRRLAEQAFGLMSSPAIHRRQISSPTPEASSVVFIGDRKLESAQRSGAGDDDDDDVEVKVEAEATKRVTRRSTKRKSDVAAAEDTSAPVDLSQEFSPRKSSTRAAKARKSVSGIPLKKTDKKEQAVLDKLAAAESSSPANSDASYSPRAGRSTTKKSASSSPAKKLRMDEIVDLLPRAKRPQSGAKAKGSQSKKKKTSTTAARKGKAASVARASTSRSKGKKAKGRAVQDDDDDDDDGEDDVDESPDEKPTRSKRKRNTGSKAKKGKARAETDSSDEDDWMAAVGSSQIHSDDSERTKRLKEFRAAEKYHLEVEDVL
ncbi:conserved hypothetical protein [Sporisorium reilianum SRZ2]|uniref:Uncharacterized protein n=1 Tax=Sporisorium reilianum (strain SRZ2) TaxID=999809 RepID=E6ZPT8_SPORE|nr:conserved hypothetical protein [Sporisorium reilianum SRZ2]